MKISKLKIKDIEHRWSTIDDWHDLGAVLMLPSRLLTYVKKFRDTHNLQTLTKVQGRETYVSRKELRAIQVKLGEMFVELLKEVPNEHMLAYMRGRTFANFVRNKCTWHDIEITWDIKGCYDHISFGMIKKTLMSLGFTEKGATLITRFCTVRRKLPNGKTIETLQQGSVCSPALSNLVCYEFIDKPLLEWVENIKKTLGTELERIEYCRYSDNVALFVTGPAFTHEHVKDFLRVSRKVLSDTRMTNHDVVVTPKNHPKRHQKFLGIILNKVARVDLEEYERTQSILFNAVRLGLTQQAYKYISEKYYESTGGDITILSPEDINKKFISVMRGKASYISQINTNQYTALKNLLNALKFIKDYLYINGELPQPIFEVVKQYRKLSVVEFLNALSEVIPECVVQAA